MKNKSIYNNNTVFISGAAGGLGKVLVKEFASLGYKVIAVDIDAHGLAEFDSAENIITETLDVTNAVQVNLFIKQLGPDIKDLDTLLCLAGIYDTYPVTEAIPDLLKKMMAVNMLGTAVLVQALLEPLRKSNGRVVVVSSESYKIQAMFQPYMISKASLEAYCRVARQELALKDIKLIVIRPGAIKTPLLNWMKQEPDTVKFPVYQKEYRKSWDRSVKMVGHITAPEKVARRIILASTVSRPKRVYRINNNPFLALITFLPAGLIDRLIVYLFRSKNKREKIITDGGTYQL